MDLVRMIEEQVRRNTSQRPRAKPLNAVGVEVPHEVRNFVEPLRALFDALHLTYREFSANRPYSPATISRYLSGERVPTEQHFREDLVEFWALQNAVDERLEIEIAARLAELHRSALEATNAKGYAKLKASENLAAAVHEREITRRQVLKLEQKLATHKQRLAIAQEEMRALESRAGEAETHRSRALALTAERENLLREINRLTEELEQARRAQAEAEQRCHELEVELEQADTAVERERIAREQEEQRRVMAEAMQVSEERLRQLDETEEQAEQLRVAARAEAARLREQADEEARRKITDAETEADRLRAEADRHARNKREDADALFEETRTKAAQAALDFETNLAKRREQSERDLSARQAKAEKRLTEIEHRAETLRKEAEELRTSAERRARQTVETAQRQSEDIVAEANVRATKVLGESQRELAEITSKRDSINAQLLGVRDFVTEYAADSPTPSEGAGSRPVEAASPPIPQQQEGTGVERSRWGFRKRR
ncbi:hypothetical protein [Streptomyces sp. FH025]|uniref:hypothetical protein n=1 Tax=Streptomyces sp. FH025 TaxID=2815937 RepID=UPI001FAF0F26|nr:hypothetical protein [Streptomyces sp. FH025]